MLKLTNIVKNYEAGSSTVEALKDVSMEFRPNEFVSVLGPSGCGKTTLLNIIGGLDQYSSGDLMINGVSTKNYKDRDWDAYRNQSIGFVFQNYNLIPHQTVLSNVELALTLSGVSKQERRERAIAVLTKVGLADQIKKKPNQMSGGQMQRVAIARALVNNPDILLADEPTGALDSETSVQIMELLREIAQDRLIIMVTHNPDLADQYSTRIIRLLDGKCISDSNPFSAEEEKALQAEVAAVAEKKATVKTNTADSGEKKEKAPKGKREKKPRTSMSLFTAFSLSMNNLLTKKTRTFLTAFAGSIGIIGIALIMSLQSGVNAYISSVEKDTLSTYPIQIQKQSADYTSMIESMMGTAQGGDHPNDKVYESSVMTDMMRSMTEDVKVNDLASLKTFIESSDIADYSTAIRYSYPLDVQIYSPNMDNGILQVNPSTVLSNMGMNNSSSSYMSTYSASNSVEVWSELLDNQDLLDSQYDVLTGTWPKNYNEIVLVVDENNEISDISLYSLGLKNPNEFTDLMLSMMMGKELPETNTEATSYTYDELMNTTFKLIMNTEYYTLEGDVWVDHRNDYDFMTNLINNAPDLKIVGIVRPNSEATAHSITGNIGYTHALTEYVIEEVNNSDIVLEQMSNPEINVFTGLPFSEAEGNTDLSSLSEEEQKQFASLSDEELQLLLGNTDSTTTSSYEDNLTLFGVVDLDDPSGINIYPKDFDSKESIAAIIDDYNKDMEAQGLTDKTISYTDMVGLFMSSITTIVNAISYILIAFVAISLVVSSIMIGIITYISVLERTKEIGILRSIGASKRDVSSVFNAETLLVGFVAGAIGILVTLILNIPINIIIKSLTDVSDVAQLPVFGSIFLIVLSMILTFIAGLVPSRMAAKKDPVVALRTE
ncbi:MAG TPA: ABC transporter ATP-binding protein/permease [Bacillota bacterium]|nr:ABC transporter ATP-binding protein/permease [Bacillota bacterium]